MASAKVKYVDIGLNSAEEYWDQIVVPKVRAFQANASSATMLDASLALWHFIDWVWHDNNRGKDSRGIIGRYQRKIKKACPEMGWLGDISDARKHRGLGRPDTTVKGTRPDLMPRTGMTVGGTGGFNEIVTIEMDDGSKQDFGAALKKAVDFWRNRLKSKDLAEP